MVAMAGGSCFDEPDPDGERRWPHLELVTLPEPSTGGFVSADDREDVPPEASSTGARSRSRRRGRIGIALVVVVALIVAFVVVVSTRDGGATDDARRRERAPGGSSTSDDGNEDAEVRLDNRPGASAPTSDVSSDDVSTDRDPAEVNRSSEAVASDSGPSRRPDGSTLAPIPAPVDPTGSSPGDQSASDPGGPGPAPVPPPPQPGPPAVVRVAGAVNGCNTYGEHCDGVPIYPRVPPEGYDYVTFPRVATVSHGSTLQARCWALGGTTYNYAAFMDPPDYGPDPFESSVYYEVLVGSAAGWIADTYFVRDHGQSLGLPMC